MYTDEVYILIKLIKTLNELYMNFIWGWFEVGRGQFIFESFRITNKTSKKTVKLITSFQVYSLNVINILPTHKQKIHQKNSIYERWSHFNEICVNKHLFHHWRVYEVIFNTDAFESYKSVFAQSSEMNVFTYCTIIDHIAVNCVSPLSTWYSNQNLQSSDTALEKVLLSK